MESTLALFPSSYLSHSVITTVWVGIWVISFFNLRFGWVFSGLVVPGYLTPLLLIKPISVAVIVFESIITYLLVYLISEVAGKRGLWTNFFGRDRFFALLLGSVFVRLLFDGWLLPALNIWSVEHYDFSLDYQDSLHSFGLIIVALIANQLWKPKLFNGLLQLVITVGITYLIVRFVLVEYTNFSLSNIGYLYEDIAGSILASPKSYIILLVTAFIASRMNLFYGWEYNGILIPSLLALQWYQPSKIIISLVEAYIIFALATLLLKSTFFKQINMEGARKVLFFFNVGFIYKVVLSLVIVEFLPEYKVSDYFGFGYLLSTLIAVKIYDKVSIPLFSRATLQTSIVSIFIATVIGYMLSLMPAYSIYTHGAEHLKTVENKLHTSPKGLMEFIEQKKIDLYEKNDQVYMKPTPSQLEIFSSVLELIDKDFYEHQSLILKNLSMLNYTVTFIEEKYLVLTQEKSNSGWGMYIIDLKEKNHLSLESPKPFEVGNIVETTVSLMLLSHAKTAAFSGISSKTENYPAVMTSNDYYSFFHTFHKHYAKGSVVQVHALTDTYRKRFRKMIDGDEAALLFIKGYIPKAFNLSILDKKLKNLKVSWEDNSEKSIQKESMKNGFAELYLTEMDRIYLIASQSILSKNSEVNTLSSVDSIEGLLQSWLLDKKLEVAEKNSNRYIPPTMQEMMYMDHSVLTPLYQILEFWKDKSIDYDQMKQQLHSITLSAKALGYKVTWYNDVVKNKRYIILHEALEEKRYWGTYIFQVDATNNLMIQTPRPFYESYTFEYSVKLFEELNAKALLLSGASPVSNSNRTADVLFIQNKESIFNLVSQVLYRQSGQSTMNALQVRGKGTLDDLDNSNAVLAFSSALGMTPGLNNIQLEIYDHLKTYMQLFINDGSMESAGYETNSLQSQYLSQSPNDTFNVLWLPYNIRLQHRQSQYDDLKVQQFRSIGIEIIHDDLLSYIKRLQSRESICLDAIVKHLGYFLKSRDTVELISLKEQPGIVIKLLIDRSNRQPYIIILSKESSVLLISKLNSQPPFKIGTVSEKQYIDLKTLLSSFSFGDDTVLKVMDSCEK